MNAAPIRLGRERRAALVLLCLFLTCGGLVDPLQSDAATNGTIPGALEQLRHTEQFLQRLFPPTLATEQPAAITETDGAAAAPETGEPPLEELQPDPTWDSLLDRLAQDGFEPAALRALFGRLGPQSYTSAYMAAKITELYGIPGIGINRDSVPPPNIPSDYEQPVEDASAGSCLDFSKVHATTLEAIKDKHGVGPDVIIALLLVETSLGLDLGRDSALRVLAAMAATDTPEKLTMNGNGRQAARISNARLAATLKEKSEWAYNELAALLRHGKQSGADVAAMPASFFGAVGICQFMPSNIEPYGADGDGDGVIDLFSITDAMYSAANYLEAHGWRAAKSEAQKLVVLMTYNHDSIYASAVLGTSKRVSRALAGKLPRQAGVVISPGFVPSARLDPSLRRLRPVPRAARVESLGGYKELLQ